MFIDGLVQMSDGAFTGVLMLALMAGMVIGAIVSRGE